ncbi:MAG: membrane dipeptidase [Planctomycetota bacterium]|nr:membrane dipeptidase [Planctomycetota bacterium]MDA1138441.1 membrane dipeptidase [Planctomycetota bacterium]
MTPHSFFEKSQALHQQELSARQLHWNTTVVLGYCNIPLHITKDGFDLAPILGHGSLCATNLERLILGGVKTIVWSPGIPYWTPDGEALRGREKVRFLKEQLRTLHTLDDLTDGQLAVARSAAEIRQINEAGGIAILLHLSGINHLNDLGILREYYDLGVRMIHCGFQDYEDPARLYHAGKLDEHGVKTIEEMKRLGVIVDMAHIKNDGFDDIVPRLEGTPFVYSHGGCHALVQHDRNLDDSRIAKLAESGGVYGIGVYIDPVSVGGIGAVNEPNAEVFKKIADGRNRRQNEIAARSESVLDYVIHRYSQSHWQDWEVRELARQKGFVMHSSIHHIIGHLKYLKENFGPDVAGFGPDFEFSYGYVAGLEEADKTPSLTRELLAAGFSEAETQGAMGHNFMRVFDEVLG